MDPALLSESVHHRPRLEVLEEEMARLENERDEAQAALDRTLESHGDDVIDKIEAIFIDPPVQDGNGEYPSVADILARHESIPRDIVDSLRTVEKQEALIADAATRLKQAAPEKAKSVADILIQLEAEINYDRLAKTIIAGYDHGTLNDLRAGYEMSLIIGMPQFLSGTNVPPYHELQRLEARIQDIRAGWEARGLLGQEPDPKSPEDTLAPSLDTIKEECDTLHQRTHELHARYRDSRYGHEKTPFQISHVIGRLQETPAPSELTWEELVKSGVRLTNQRLETALAHTLYEHLQHLSPNQYELDMTSPAYLALRDEARAIDVEAVLEAIDIKGDLNELPIDLTEADLKRFLGEDIPGLALANTIRIEFRTLTPEEEEEDGTKGFQQYSEELGGSLIVISTNYFKELYALGADIRTPRDRRWRTKLQLLDTLSHEFGHVLHSVAPIALLAQWEAARSRDALDITSYVRLRYDQGHPHRFKEDFADCMRYFVRQPAMLHILSPERFEGQLLLYKELMSGIDTTAISAHAEKAHGLLESVNTTAEDERAAHLADYSYERPSVMVQVKNRE